MRTTTGAVAPQLVSRSKTAATPAVAVPWWLGLLGLAGVGVVITGQLLHRTEQYRVELIGDASSGRNATRTAGSDDVGELPRPVPSDDAAPNLAAAPIDAQENGTVEPTEPPTELSTEPPADSPPDAVAVAEEPPALTPSSFRVAEIPVRTATGAATGVGQTDRRSPSVRNGRVVLDPAEHPLLGSTNAQYVVIEVFDYTCKHCRALHHHLQRARQHYGDRLAIVTLPMPMNGDCNQFVEYTHPDHVDACDYARLALMVWETDPTTFESFHDWLLQEERPPSVAKATGRAEQLVGKDTLSGGQPRAAADRRIADYARIFDQLGGGGVPKLIIGKHAVTVQSVSSERILGLLERYLEAKP